MKAISPERERVAASWWSRVLPSATDSVWSADIRRIVTEAEARRARADYNTGSITEQEAYQLRALAEHLQARTVIEVGTFIGTSTCALASASSVQRVYTCDASNDCLPSTSTILTFPKQSSTQMLRRLSAVSSLGLRADLCFFDGTLLEVDLALLSSVCGPRTVFAVHDYNYGPKLRKTGMVVVPRKGIGNVALLRRAWSTHVLVDPRPETTLALLVPEALL